MSSRPFSRDMPTRDQLAPLKVDLGWRITGYALLLGGLGGLVVKAIAAPLFFAVLAVTVALIAALSCNGARKYEAKLQQLLAAREDDSICTFACSFDRRTVDPWVIRAVWEECRELAGRTKDGNQVPLRSTDILSELLPLDEEDLEFTILDAGRRAGKCIDNFEQNPYYAKVKTIGDCVLLLNAQPPA